MNYTNKIVFAAYIILMAFVVVMFNNGTTDHSAGDAVEQHSETAATPESTHDTDIADDQVAHQQASTEESDITEDPAAHKEAIEPDEESAKKSEKLTGLNQALETIANVDHRKAESSDQEENPFSHKPSPDLAIATLQQGNDRFINGESVHPNLDADRLKLAGTESQGDHAFATVITCSDSRVPVEAIFDAGIMDIFVIRVAGNVCDVDERGSIEYGLAHVHTPVLVVLGHTQCGAVTAVTHALQGHGHELERNIPDLVANIKPAVKKAMEIHPDITGDAIIPMAIEENVWTGIEELFMESPVTRDFVSKGFAKVVGAIYDVGTGKVNWLPEDKTFEILEKVEASPDKAVIASAECTSHHHGEAGSADAEDQHKEEGAGEALNEKESSPDSPIKTTEDPAVSHT